MGLQPTRANPLHFALRSSSRFCGSRGPLSTMQLGHDLFLPPDIIGITAAWFSPADDLSCSVTVCGRETGCESESAAGRVRRTEPNVHGVRRYPIQKVLEHELLGVVLITAHGDSGRCHHGRPPGHLCPPRPSGRVTRVASGRRRCAGRPVAAHESDEECGSICGPLWQTFYFARCVWGTPAVDRRTTFPAAVLCARRRERSQSQGGSHRLSTAYRIRVFLIFLVDS